MGNIIESFFSGLGHGIASLFNTPLDFLSGKSCNSACGTTWDFICYIENFCVTHLLKMAMVLLLCYIALLFLYALYKLGICGCVARSLCRIYWACFVSFFSTWHYCCNFLFVKILGCRRRRRRRRRRENDVEMHVSSNEDEYESSDASISSSSSSSDDTTSSMCAEAVSRSVTRLRRSGIRGNDRIRRSLRPQSHRIRVHSIRSFSHRRISTRQGNGKSHRSSVLYNDLDDHVRVTRTSKFARKGSIRRHRKPR